MNKAELVSLNGWNFDWLADDLINATVYKLTIENNKEIQGLVAITDFIKSRAVYVNIAESAPHNIGKSKRYEGVGGHLFAIAAAESMKKGYGGFMFLDAKNVDLVEHYTRMLGAKLLGIPHPYRLVVEEEEASQLLKKYTLNKE